MNFKSYIRLFSGRVISESKLDKDSKIQLLNYVKEADIYEVIALLMDGQIQTVSEQSKPIVLERFKKTEIPNKIKYFVEQENKNKNEKTEIDKDDVKQAAMKTAKKVHGKADKKIVDDIVKKAIDQGKDTEDAIQIAINMLRS